MPVPGTRNTGEDWSTEAKLAIVVETASMSEAELSAYCREKGLYPEQVQRWNEACLQGAGMQQDQDKAAQKQERESRKAIRKLKAEARRKDKALAETTSLLVLSKKLEALYGEDPDSSEDD
tara:strand:+ start:140 stop:502 length:363 start_codon:yes stop_codon:yes gene_type:complete